MIKKYNVIFKVKVLENELMSRHTTFKIGGPARMLKLPESQDELIEEVSRCRKDKESYRILGRGSNLLVNDRGLNETIIKNTKACLDLEIEGETVYVGSSVALQKMIRFFVENNLEGLEYLYSVPATVGGAIFMNAGRGAKHNLSISDRIVSITVFDGKRVFDISKKNCGFSYRESIFHKKREWLILGARFRLNLQDKGLGLQKIEARMEEVKVSQERKHPSAGTVFRSGFRGFRILKGFRLGGAQFTGNWISNVGDASFKDVVNLIRVQKFLAACLMTKAELEVEIWK